MWKEKALYWSKIPNTENSDYIFGGYFIGGVPPDFTGQLVETSTTFFLDAIIVDGVHEKQTFINNNVDEVIPCKDIQGTKNKDGKYWAKTKSY